MNAQAPAQTRNALATLGMDALDRERVGKVAVSAVAGGVSFASALEVMEFAKLMSVADKAVPPHLRNNPGMCLAVTFQAVEWRMSPFAVAGKSYVVNDRIAYESQLVHAVVEARASLKQRLNCSYAGEGPTRTCTVVGHFIGDTEPREYTSPMLKDIKVKNSPLWVGDPDQQLFYYSSRSWARKWAPDVLMGIYTREELQDAPALGREDEPADDLRARLAAGEGQSSEGHQGGGHIEGELAKLSTSNSPIKPADKVIEGKAESSVTETTTGKGKGGKKDKKADKAAEPAAKEQEAEVAATDPNNAAEYEAYARRWIEAATDKDDAEARWDGEREQQQALKVPAKVRTALRALIDSRFP